MDRPVLFRGLPIFLLALLLLFPGLSVQGASQGLLLWANVVLPTLAPFLICTQCVRAADGVRLLMRPFYPVLGRVFGLSLQGSYILLCGLLCGYPLGAKLCGDAWEQGELSDAEAQYLLAICNHPSPMFLLGYVSGQLPQPVPAWVLLAGLYLPILPLSWLAASRYRFQKGNPAALPSQGARLSLDRILLSSAETMVLIGGYMMLFSILALWLRQLTVLPGQVQALLAGAAEMTTGIHQICQSFPGRSAVPPAVAAAAFGGVSGICQTRGVLGTGLRMENAGWSIRHYVLWKLLHAVLTWGALTLLLQALPLR